MAEGAPEDPEGSASQATWLVVGKLTKGSL